MLILKGGRDWLAVQHTYFLVLLGTYLDYISQPPLQLGMIM